MTPSAFDSLAASLDPSMVIVTVPGPEGCLVGFHTHASIDPPRFLVCLSKKNRTFRAARDASALAVHVVPEDATDLAELFGGETGDELDKFKHCDWAEGPRGLPLLGRCPDRFCGEVLERFDCGDHVAFLLKPFQAEQGDGTALPFREAMEIEPGHEA